MNHVHAEAPALDPRIPAAVGVGDVHPGDDGVGGVIGRRADPEGEAEALILLEVAEARQLGRLAIEEEPLGAGRAGLPGRLGGERKVAVGAGDLHLRDAPLPFGETELRCGRVLGEERADGVGSRGGDPGIELRPGRALPGLDGGAGGGELLLELREAGEIIRLRHRHDRRRVVDVAIHRRLGRVIEERRQLVELLLRERIELVVVADGAASRQPHPHRGRRLGPVAAVDDPVFLVDRPPFARRDVAAVEAAGDLVVELDLTRQRRRLGVYQVAGELENRELVKRHVAVERIGDPLPVGPQLAEVVDVDAVGVAVPGVIEPVAAAVLAPIEA